MSESVSGLLDTNILVYAMSAAPEDASKKAIASALLRRLDLAVCAQVLHEFYNVMTRKPAHRVPGDLVARMLNQFDAFPSVDLDRAMVKRGAELSIAHSVSYWDGAIIAAAERLGAKTLYSEDMSHGQAYGSVRVENPFLNA